MTVYIIMYILIMLGVSFANNNMESEKDKRKWACIIFFFAVTLVISLRHKTMGSDLNNYIFSFKDIRKMSWERVWNIDSYLNYEKGYVLLNKLVGVFFKDPQWIMVTAAVLMLLPTAYIIYKYSKNVFLSMIIFLALPSFLMVYSGLRQAIAIGITTYSMKYIKEKKFWHFAVLCVIAYYFHSSALIFLFAYPLYYVRLTDKMAINMVVVLAIVFVAKVPLFRVFSRLFKDNAQAGNTGAGNLFYMFCVILIASLRVNRHSEDYGGDLNIFYFACVCQAFSGVYNIAMRVGYYFMVALMLSAPKTTEKLRKDDFKKYSVAMPVIIFGAIAIGLYFIYRSGKSWPMSYPYYFFWQDVVK